MGVFIIAEAGVNHNGDLELAKKLIDKAAEAKCDAVKFQTFKAENIVTKGAKKAEYQIENTHEEGSQFDMLKKLELNFNDHKILMDYAKGKNIIFLSTAFDDESLELLISLDISLFKIPSGEITNKYFIKKIAQYQKPIILSTGMSTLGEVEAAIKWIGDEGNNQITLLHCTTNYPTEMEDVNLKAMLTLKEAFKVKVGYSDHTAGIEVPIAAVALGAEVIEKHFTLDKSMEGPDHKASLNPIELVEMVKSIRNVEMCLGDGIKKPVKNELVNIIAGRKSIIASRDIQKDEIIQSEALCIKRPGSGIEPKFMDELIGKRAKDFIAKDSLIRFEDIV